ncbi:MAG: SNF2-related protein [Candidatus Faecousia sp.]|nr:SNF2-related protein [Candidatus Faecousia sp.]
MPQEYIDQFLRYGSNTENHRTRIAIEFAKQQPMDYLVDFLEKTYHGGCGLQFGTTKVCAWYAEDGMHLAYGSAARYARNAQILSWEDVAVRVGELLEQGQFATNVELAECRTFEKRQLSEQLWYMSHDISEKAIDAGYMSIVRSLRGGFPEETEKLMVFLSEPESYQAIMRQVYAFRDAYNADKGMMRFQMYHPNKLIRPLEEYTLPRREYVSEMAELPAAKGFITEDEINEHLTGGSNFSGSKSRIYAFYQTPHTAKEKLDFLKNEYGIGGGNNALSRNFMSHVWTDGKGIRYDKPNCTRMELPWTKVVKYYDALVESGRFAPPEELKQRYGEVIDNELAEEQPESEEAEPIEATDPIQEESEPAVWEYNEIKAAHPEDIVLYQVGDFFEIYGEDAKQAAPMLDLHLGSRPIPTGGRVDMCGIPAHQLEENLDKLRLQHSVTISAVSDDGSRNVYSLGKLEPPIAHRELTQADIDEALQKWNGSIDSKRAVVRYMEAHSRERDTAAWLAREYGADPAQPLRIAVTGVDGETVLPWAKVQRRIAQLIKAEKFYTEEEYDRLDDIDPVAIREQLAEHGIVDGEVMDTDKLDAAPIVRQAETDAQRISDEEFARDHLIPGESTFEIDGRTFLVDRVNLDFGSVNFQDITFVNSTGFPIFRTEPISFVRRYIEQQEAEQENPPVQPEISTETVAVFPGEKTNLPYDVVVQTLRTEKPEPPRDAPIPSSENFRITDEDLGMGGAKVKFRRNMDAITTLKTIESEGRQATREEQEILSWYVGWGGLPDAFDDSKSGWASEYQDLKSALSPAEYEAARASTLNAHYTSPTVIRAIYEAVGNMGFQTGNILEPSMGVGNFFGMLPEEMRNSRLYGEELDSITGRIAKQLYPKANVTVAGFETTDRRDFFDLAVGNVPFGQYKVNDPAYNKLGFNIHNYFFAKALDQVRPGGVVAFVTSRYTLDAKDSTVRRYLAQRADLLGAIRLPNTAFKANAGTEVVSDIIFLQKRDRPIEIDPDWVHLGQTEDGYAINSYFLDHPEMVMGRNSSESTAHGMDYTVEPLEDISLADQLHEAVRHIQGTYQEAELPDLGEGEAIQNTLPADPDVKNFSYTLVDGEVYFRENSIMVRPDLNATAKERIKGMLTLSTCVHELIDLQMNETIPDSAIQEKQGELNRLYDSFTEKYGLINSRGNKLAFSDDSSYFLLCALEVMDDDGDFQRKADMFTKRTIQPHRVVTSVDTASEALTISIAERACVDLGFMSSLSGKPVEELTADLRGVIFHDPTLGPLEDHAGWVTADEYLSGNVRQKLRQAEAAAAENPAYQVNVEALRAAQPKDLDASEIEVRLGATWIDKSYIKQFMFETFDTPRYLRYSMDVQYSPYTAAWSISSKTRISYNDVAAWNTYGTDCVSAYEILEDSLNLRDVQVFDTIEDADGKKKRVLNAKETTLAAQKQQLIRDAFKDWIWAEPNRRQALVRQYNEEMNSIRPREYDGSHIVFAGMNPEITLREHQRNAIAHVLYGGNTLLAHEVGAGKTFEMVAAAMESKRLGLCQKSIFVVPNHLTEQWASEFLRLYPSANILVTKQRDFETKNRKKFCARIATGDYDAVIIGHSQFEKIPISKQRQERLLQDQIAEITVGISELRESGGEKFTVKELERTKRGLESRLEKLRADDKKDDVVTFEELGVDRMFVDEAHNYKNLFLYTKMRNVAGLSTTDAQKSSDMFGKCRYMDELTGNRGVVFATGTPVSNSMTELYTMQRYLQYARLEEMHMTHFDCWASRFGETVTALELAPEGKGYRPRTRFSRFFNLPELMNLFKEVADIKTADQLHLPVPEVEYHNVVAKPTEVQKGLVQELSERAAAIHSGSVDPSTDNMLKVTSDGRKLGLDQRIINPDFPDQDGSKVNLCVENILQVWKDGEADKLTQLVFCDISTPQAAPKAKKAVSTNLDTSAPESAMLPMEEKAPFTVYDDIRSKLIAKGIPAEQIAFIHDANTEVKKKELFGKVRSGQVRVLLGSTSKMGAGTNVQDRLVAIHDVDCPWRPGDLQQRKGRIERQGNQNEKVHVFRYVTEGTFDAYLWQTVENKQKFISQIMSSKSPVRSCDDVDEVALSFAEIKALCAGDPRIKERMDLDVEVSKLKIMKADYKSKQYRLEDNLLRHFPEQIEKLKGCIQAIQEDMQTLGAHPHPTDGFAGMTVLADELTDKDNAGAALIEAAKKATGLDPVEVGTYRGFQMSVTLEDFGKKYVLTMQGKLRHQATLGSDPRGNLIRLDNALAQMPQRLKAFQTQLDETYHQQEAAKAELGKPFPYEEELRDKTARLIFLDSELNLDANKGGQQEQVVAKTARPSVLDKLRSQPAPSRTDKKQKRHEEVR